MADHNDEPPFEGGSQPVPERPTGVPGEGRSALQVVVIALAVLMLLAAIFWAVVPIISGSNS